MKKFKPKGVRKYHCPRCGELLIKIYPWSAVELENYGKGLFDEGMIKMRLKDQGLSEKQIKKELDRMLASRVCGKCRNQLSTLKAGVAQ